MLIIFYYIYVTLSQYSFNNYYSIILCSNAIHHWITLINYLLLNKSKSERLNIPNGYDLQKYPLTTLITSEYIKYLGVLFDRYINVNKHMQ